MTRKETENKSIRQEDELFPVFKFDLDNRLVFANLPAIPLMKEWKCRVNERIPADVISTYPELFHSTMSHRPQEITVEMQECHIKFAIVPFPEAGFIGMYAFCLEKNGKIANQRVFDTAEQVKQESL